DVLIAEQVFTDKNGNVKPFTNRDVEHLVKTVIKLEKNSPGCRQATIMKHRAQPEGKTALFHITQKGLN
ncbi:MAG: DNA repair and recombination protein RadB, partial [Candidatus Thermoplasmatota archaeon]|nr:DNA repair and recombination protein RadB [Candidatus Thermoplasmatota archaeon]